MSDQLFKAFAQTFDSPCLSFIRGEVREMPKREMNIRALINHPSTTDGERDAARRALERIKGRP